MESRKKIVDKIIELEKEYSKIYILNIKSIELFDKKIKKYKIIKNKIKVLNELLEEIDNKNYNNFINNKISKKDIILIDMKYKLNLYELFIKLKYELDSSKKVKIINKIRNSYFKILKNIDKGNYEEKRKIKKILVLLQDILLDEKKNKNKNIFEKEKIKFETNKKEIQENKNNELYDLILNNENLSSYELDEIIDIYKIIIRKYELNEKLLYVANYIVKRIEKENKNEENVIQILDVIKYRKIDASNEEYEILNEIKKVFKDYKNTLKYSHTKKVVDDKYKYEIIERLLEEENYSLIKKLLKEYDEYVNVRKDNRHIVCIILEIYLKNLEYILNRKYDISLNLEYVLEVYRLFTRNYNLKLNEDDKYDINNQIYIFISRMTSKPNKNSIELNGETYKTIYIKNEDKKTEIKESVKELSTYHHKYHENNLKQIMYDIRFDIPDYGKYNSDEIKDLTDKEHIVLDNSFVCYNYNKESKVLRISIPDITGIVGEKSILSDYMFNQMVLKEDIDYRLKERLKYKNNEEKYSITFKINFEEEEPKLYIYRSKVKPTMLKEKNQMYNDLKEFTNNDDIELSIKKILNKLYLEKVKEEELPFIYFGLEKENDISSRTYNDIISIPKRIPRKEYKKIYNILNSNLGEFHYSDEEFEVVDNYDLNLIGECNSIFLLNQKVILNLMLKQNEYYNRYKENYIKECRHLIEVLNKELGYVKVLKK